MKALAGPALGSAATSISTMAGFRIRALTERPPIKPTSPRCHAAWQLNLGRHSTYRRGKSVQTTGTTSNGAGVGFIFNSRHRSLDGRRIVNYPLIVVSRHAVHAPGLRAAVIDRNRPMNVAWR